MGTVSGPTLMALADFAMYVVLLSAIGPVGLAVTTSLNINFLRKGQPGQDVLAAAKLMKLGKRLAVGEVSLLSGTSPGSDCSCDLDLTPFRTFAESKGIITPYFQAIVFLTIFRSIRH